MNKPIELCENFGWPEAKFPSSLQSNAVAVDKLKELLKNKENQSQEEVIEKNDDKFLYKLQLINDSPCFSTSYFVGVYWIIKNEIAICIRPKEINADKETDCLTMLFEAMKSIDLKHLENLYKIYFDEPQIEIDHQQDMLSSFLFVQFLKILKRIAQKGLKKTYYPVIENLEAKIKGKLLVNKTIKTNILKNRITKNLCQYNEFGINGEENKILKKALIFVQHAIENYKIKIPEEMEYDLNYISPAFEKVSDDIQIDKIKGFKPNPIYKEYSQALKLALLILKRYSYSISEKQEKGMLTPPFWINMAKLFELYVFKKLQDIFKQGEVLYHKTVSLEGTYQELDFLIKSENYSIVADAKYKRYGTNGRKIEIEDIRQVCGYARLEEVYRILNKEGNENIDCFIIYPDQGCEQKFSEEQFENEKKDVKELRNFYKAGIGLPTLKIIENQN